MICSPGPLRLLTGVGGGRWGGGGYVAKHPPCVGTHCKLGGSGAWPHMNIFSNGSSDQLEHLLDAPSPAFSGLNVLLLYRLIINNINISVV